MARAIFDFVDGEITRRQLELLPSSLPERTVMLSTPRGRSECPFYRLIVDHEREASKNFLVDVE